MDEAMKAQIRAKLMTEKERLEQELSTIGQRESKNGDDFQATFPQFGSDEGENAAEVADYESRLSIEHTLEGALRDVETAMERLEAGSYGICKYCQQPIEEQRLLARPTSSSCVACKKRLTGE